jgi:uncharacterized protein (TIGR02145 family)
MKHLLWLPVTFIVLFTACKKEKPAKPASVTTTTVSNITGNSAQTGGTITSDGGSSITKSGVCWALHANPAVGDSLTVSGATSGSFASTLSNLVSNTTYYVRAYAINARGTAYGNEINFTTAKGLAAITTNPISSLVPLSAQSGGTIVSDGGASITERGIVWSLSEHPTTERFKAVDHRTDPTFTDSITPIGSQTLYYVRAYAINSYGTSYGNEISFTSASADAVTDVDGNVYRYITIGTQTWMTSNLKVIHYQNGDPITNGVSNFDWALGTTGAYTFPAGDSANDAVFGKLYNIYAVQDNRSICPAGWHVPTDGEWETLELYEGMNPADTGTLDFRGTIGAKFLEGGSAGLNIQKSGYLYPDSPVPSYDGLNVYGGAWSSTRSTDVGLDNLFFRIFNLSSDPGPIYKEYGNYGLPIRCVKD